MKKLKIFAILALVGLSLVSCSSSDKEEYWPNPDRGDYMKVSRMEVIRDVEKQHLLEALYTIEYNYFLKLHKLKEFQNVDLTALPAKAPISYSFSYLKDDSLNKIVIKKDEEIDLDELTASYQGGDLVSINGKKGESEVLYQSVNANNLKVTQGYKAYDYEFDNTGNLIAVSDNTGKLFSYKYGVGHNPFEHSEYNLTFDYIPGGELIRFVKSSRNEITSAKNEKTGEEFNFDYKLHDFGYPTEMIVKGSTTKTLFKFEYNIIRERE